ncbi:hypothetical protein [Coxiella burnetii]|uniref:hypothetical protein n=2 Tax=Coxiella burnetii TaxID=777 RepID=UPI0011D075FC|nr:hypothetical protein [Coxiella burnetii]
MDNYRCDQLMKQWWLLDDANLRESMKIGLINLATQAYIDAHPEVRYIDAYSYAVSLFEDEEPLTLPPFWKNYNYIN